MQFLALEGEKLPSWDPQDCYRGIEPTLDCRLLGLKASCYCGCIMSKTTVDFFNVLFLCGDELELA